MIGFIHEVKYVWDVQAFNMRQYEVGCIGFSALRMINILPITQFFLS